MLAKVVKPFPYYGDGVTLENLNEGDERDFGSMTEGLIKAGLVVVGEVPKAAVEVAVETIEEPPLETKPAVEEPIETKPARRARK